MISKGTSKQDVLAEFLLGKRAPSESVDALRQNFSRFKRRLEAFDNDKEKGFSCAEKDFSCGICYEFMVFPSQTICGHSFCEHCLGESLLRKEGCPICSTSLRAYEPSTSNLLATIIACHVNSLPEEVQKVFKARCEVATQRKEQARVTSAKVDDLIDVRDTEYFWCSARILRVVEQKGCPISVLVHYENWDKVYDEFISLSSPRIAKHGTFTNRIDIPRYSNSRGNTQEMDSGIVEIPEGGFFTVMPVPGASQEEEDSNGERRQPLLHLSPVNLPFRNLLSLFGFDGFLLNIRLRTQGPPGSDEPSNDTQGGPST